MSATNPFHIIVIGAGIAGPGLAQLLRKHDNIKVSIYERDASASSRRQTWAISLTSSLGALIPALPKSLGSLENVSTVRRLGTSDKSAILDHETGEARLQWGYGKPGTNNYLIFGSRGSLREYLAQELNIIWGKKFVSHEEDADGVTAIFEDGERVKGDMLVGVDGAGSHVRTQLLGEQAQPSTCPYGVLAGDQDLTAEQHERVSMEAESFFITINDGKMLFVGIRSAEAPSASSEKKGPAKYFYHLHFPDPKAAEHSDEKPYWTQTAKAEDLHKKALELTEGWGGPGRYLIESTKLEDVLSPPYLLRDWAPSEDLTKLPSGRITLMGDAAHAMTPFRGIGANTALLDAVDLSALISEKANSLKEPGVLQGILDQYWAKIAPRGRGAVAVSRAGITDDPNGDKTVAVLRNMFEGKSKEKGAYGAIPGQGPPSS